MITFVTWQNENLISDYIKQIQLYNSLNTLNLCVGQSHKYIVNTIFTCSIVLQWKLFKKIIFLMLSFGYNFQFFKYRQSLFSTES